MEIVWYEILTSLSGSEFKFQEHEHQYPGGIWINLICNWHYDIFINIS